MKYYTITVNGTAYDVTVEEKDGPEPASESKNKTPETEPFRQPELVKDTTPAPTENQGSIEIKAGTAGKVFRIEVSIGQHVKKGESLVIIEAMKMEIPIITPSEATVVSIEVKEGQSVEAGDVLITLAPF